MTRIPDPVEVLRDKFDLPSFRGPQREAIDAVLEGRDLLLIMPTGGGKSLVYQLPSLMLPGLTLVISPLIALMKDQVDQLRAKGLRATFVNSSIEGKERRRRLQEAVDGELDLLFVTPERFRSPDFRAILDRLEISRMAVDEAHCISHWGHDFRPDYSRLGEYRQWIGKPPTLALTATATPAVAEDIVTRLGLEDPLVLRTGIERPNLFLGSTPIFTADEKLPILAARVREIGGPGIVYSALIKDLEELHSQLKRQGIHSLVYHGKLSPEERRRMQERFMASDREIVLATNAFGMGVDKEDIRFVLHAQMPRTLEAWAQEVGRAGRDGKPSYCEMLYFPEDVAVQQNFVNWANPTLEYLFSVYEVLRGWGERLQAKDLDDLRDELLVKNRGDNRVSICLKWLEVLGVTRGSFETHDFEVVGELRPGDLPDFVGTEEKHRNDLKSLFLIMEFAKSKEECRRIRLARHFGLSEEEVEVPCGHCDVCTNPDQWREERLSAREEKEGSRSSDFAPGFKRGDWVRVNRRHLGQVLRVEGEGPRLRLLVEDTTDLVQRTFDPSKVRVERVRTPRGKRGNRGKRP